jgi:hypothetical protein
MSVDKSHILWKENKPNKHEELTEWEIFEKIKEDLNPIQENLAEQKITVEEAKSELKKINEWLQWTKLENQDKKEIWKAFEKLLIKLEKDINENALKNEVDEIIKLVENLTKRDLANLKRGIQQNQQRWNPERTAEVQEGIDESSDKFDLTIHDATEDKNPVARKIGERMEYLMS